MRLRTCPAEAPNPLWKIAQKPSGFFEERDDSSSHLMNASGLLILSCPIGCTPEKQPHHGGVDHAGADSEAKDRTETRLQWPQRCRGSMIHNDLLESSQSAGRTVSFGRCSHATQPFSLERSCQIAVVDAVIWLSTSCLSWQRI